jgi:hypothetical protein
MISATEDHFVLPVSLTASPHVRLHHPGFRFRRHA